MAKSERNRKAQIYKEETSMANPSKKYSFITPI
jgi:hypothetical protein